MRLLLPWLAAVLAGCGSGSLGPCKPAGGAPSYLAGQWHAPEQLSDFSVDLQLQGGPDGICGSSSSTFPGTDAGGGRSARISGTERELQFDYPAGGHETYAVVRDDETHITLGLTRYVRR
jgi:hypothetical protein